MRSNLAAGLSDEKDKINTEISELRVKRLAELDSRIETEYASRLSAIENELKERRDKFEAEIKAEEQKLVTQKAELDKLLESLNTEKLDLESEKNDVKFQRSLLERKTEDLERSIEVGIREKQKEFKVVIADKERAYNDLLGKFRSGLNLVALKEELEEKYGNPQEFRDEVKAWEEKQVRKEEENIQWREAKRAEIREELDRKNEELIKLRGEKDRLNGIVNNVNDRLVELNKTLGEKIHDVNELIMQRDEEERLKVFFEGESGLWKTKHGELNEQFQILNSQYRDAEGIEKRITTIETPLPEFEKKREREEKVISEMDWLSKIQNSCDDHGYIFSPRLLYAFHTALKTADWSCITVLTGASGMGKSKLPELYSHFGGINFFNLPVQPNWDSKESLLGFFNSIERTFDAQEVLRFLAQTQLEYPKYFYGLKDTLNIVLLDEMNLAHVELYFAEFLSKLEERSGKEPGQEPSINIKLGSGEKDNYPLKLGRNVLWVGTMNQDETTKSLSDKVLDRGIVISFPRPTSLEHRKKEPLPNRAPLLSFEVWKQWKRDDTAFAPSSIGICRDIIEKVNGYMKKVGPAAIGYRVWQSIEQYMINHPLVIRAQVELEEAQNNKDEASVKIANESRRTALHDAFTDQLAQKVMPKLRGIETSGTQRKDCLDPIWTLLSNMGYEELKEDYMNAMNIGNGQFVWNSSDYLNSSTTNRQN